MRRVDNLLLVGLALGLVVAGTTQAGTVTFEDSVINFPGYDTGGWTRDDSVSPLIQNMVVEYDNTSRALTKVTLNLETDEYQSYDSLFINSNYEPMADGSFNTLDWDSWDYFIHAGGDSHSGSNTAGNAPGDGLYEVDDIYSYTTVASGGRPDHHNGIDNGSLTPLSSLTTGFYTTGNSMIVYDFSKLTDTITLGENFSFAYSPWCANDVIYGATTNIAHAPEPTTMLLFGTGLAGLAGWRRKKTKK